MRVSWVALGWYVAAVGVSVLGALVLTLEDQGGCGVQQTVEVVQC